MISCSWSYFTKMRRHFAISASGSVALRRLDPVTVCRYAYGFLLADMTRPPRSELETARRRVSVAEARVIRQMAIIEELVRDNHPRTAHVARNILATHSDSLDRARDTSGH